jgi:hypothetical protein
MRRLRRLACRPHTKGTAGDGSPLWQGMAHPCHHPKSRRARTGIALASTAQTEAARPGEGSNRPGQFRTEAILTVTAHGVLLMAARSRKGLVRTGDTHPMIRDTRPCERGRAVCQAFRRDHVCFYSVSPDAKPKLRGTTHDMERNPRLAIQLQVSYRLIILPRERRKCARRPRRRPRADSRSYSSQNSHRNLPVRA